MREYFQNKKIWITGASSGIGRALAEELSRLGSYVILSSRNQNSLTSIKSQLSHPEKCEIHALDMEDEPGIDNTCKTVLEKHEIDIFILNAGISQRANAHETSSETERRIMQTNFFGGVRMSKSILKQMKTNAKGHFIIMSSVTGKIGVPGRSSYAASKHALIGYFDSLRAEEEDNGIFVTTVCPGYIHTNISQNALKANGKPQLTKDQKSADGMPVNIFVNKLLKAVSRKKKEVIIGGKETLGIYLRRINPNLLFKVVKNIKT
jgi:short-subunit dehydrogenase